MSTTDTHSTVEGVARHTILIGAPLPEAAVDVIATGDVPARSHMATLCPEMLTALLLDDDTAEPMLVGQALAPEMVSAVIDRCVVLDHAELNATELFNWFTRHEQARLAMALVAQWRERGLSVVAESELIALQALAQPQAIDSTALVDMGAAAAAVALAVSPGAAMGKAADLMNAASALTALSVVDLEAQAADELDAMSSSPDALGFGALTLARQPSVGEPGVSCNRSLINALCHGCRERAHHNALDTLRNRLQSGQLRTTEMLDHLLVALKNCGGVRRVHLLEVDRVAGSLKSRRRLQVRGATPLHPIDISLGAAPALESMLLSPQTRVISPDAVHPDVAALAESPLVPATHSLVGSLLVADRPQAVIVVDGENLPLNAADAQRVDDLLQLGAKLMSLLAPTDSGWNRAANHDVSALRATCL